MATNTENQQQQGQARRWACEQQLSFGGQTGDLTNRHQGSADKAAPSALCFTGRRPQRTAAKG